MSRAEWALGRKSDPKRPWTCPECGLVLDMFGSGTHRGSLRCLVKCKRKQLEAEGFQPVDGAEARRLRACGHEVRVEATRLEHESAFKVSKSRHTMKQRVYGEQWARKESIELLGMLIQWGCEGATKPMTWPAINHALRLFADEHLLAESKATVEWLFGGWRWMPHPTHVFGIGVPPSDEGVWPAVAAAVRLGSAESALPVFICEAAHRVKAAVMP